MERRDDLFSLKHFSHFVRRVYLEEMARYVSPVAIFFLRNILPLSHCRRVLAYRDWYLNVCIFRY